MDDFGTSYELLDKPYGIWTRQGLIRGLQAESVSHPYGYDAWIWQYF